jgi:hypothetical protein
VGIWWDWRLVSDVWFHPSALLKEVEALGGPGALKLLHGHSTFCVASRVEGAKLLRRVSLLESGVGTACLYPLKFVCD